MGDFDGVAFGLLDDAEKDAGLAVVAGDRAVVFHAGFSASDVTQADDLRAFVLDDELIVLFGRLEFAAGLDGHLAVEVLNAAAGQLDILLVQRAFDVEHRDAAGRHFFRIEPEPHGEALFAGDPNAGNAFDGLEAVLDLRLGQARQFERRVARAVQPEPDDGESVGVLLGDDRLFDVVGQQAAHARDAVTHVLRAQVDVAREVELDGDAADLLTALAGERLDAFDVIDLLLQPLGDFRFDDGRVRAGINGRHADNRRIDVRQLAHRQA